ncbi:MAG: Asp23/Gls24 family envelope stress response protein [Coriobacteriales bacterium]|jgi:uncharacterized alkaline shock family protein YloU|nr:Asp23/Gls24 family envelope stress response protein [Coriobacteriales bacterium]
MSTNDQTNIIANEQAYANTELTIAPGVLETIASMAVLEVEGVSSLTTITPQKFLRAILTKNSHPGIFIYEEEGTIKVDVHVHVFYGFVLPEVAANIRASVTDALLSQVNISVTEVNVFIEAVQFAA